MDVRNCISCGKPFIFVRVNLCPDCQAAEEEKYERVRVYLRDNPGSSLDETVKNTGVSREDELKMCRTGRIECGIGSSSYLNCIRCGTPIATGSYCAECALDILSKIQDVKEKVAEEIKPGNNRDRNRMYTRPKL